MKNYIVSLSCFALLICSGCAWYKIQPVSSAQVATWSDDLPEGYVFYQPDLYFAATISSEPGKDATGKDTVKTSVTVAPLYLPNYAKPYRVTTHNFLAKADFAFDFENGWKLTKLADKGDNSTVANTLAGQLGTMLKAAGLGIMAASPHTRVVLFRPTFDSKTGYFTGFKEVGVLVDQSS